MPHRHGQNCIINNIDININVTGISSSALLVCFQKMLMGQRVGGIAGN